MQRAAPANEAPFRRDRPPGDPKATVHDMTLARRTQGRKSTLNAPTKLGTFLGTNDRRQMQPDGVRRKRSRSFCQEKRSDQARRNQTQKTLENLKTAARERFGVDYRTAARCRRA